MTNKHKILVTGGAGFIGTQVTHELVNAGHEVTVVDRNMQRQLPCEMIEADYLDFFDSKEFHYDTVVHLAAEHNVPQSIPDPSKYYANNVIKMKGMLDHMVARGIKNIVFSSTGNVYGRQGSQIPLMEDANYYDPMNPYASSKVAGETMIQDYARAYGLRFVIFRYFNAAGADPKTRFGYTQRPATNVIPVLCQSLIRNEPFNIYGSNFATPDGTCVRDYVHIYDIAQAHLLAMDYLDSDEPSEIFNLGGRHQGVSINQLVRHASDALNIEYPKVSYKPPRIGDPPILIADTSKAKYGLGWTPMYSIEDTIIHAWKWEKKLEASK